jgi:two-component system, LytTR family, response regulator
MISSIIVDDEARSRATLETLLHRYCSELELCGSAATVSEALQLIRRVRPRLLFLDISMPDGTGFDLLQQLGPADLAVIFITAHNDYAINAIKVHALDYLLKPINIAELQQAVQHAVRHIDKQGKAAGIQPLLDHLDRPEPKLVVPVADGLHFIPLAQIVRLSARGSYTEIHSNTGDHILSSRSLKEYEDRLPAAGFFRAHHSHIINLSFIRHYHRGDGGYVTMTDGSVIDISKRKKKDFLDLFQF